MGRGWLAVDAGAVAAGEDLAFWVRAALDLRRPGRGYAGGRGDERRGILSRAVGSVPRHQLVEVAVPLLVPPHQPVGRH
jgi:hypothetical protein